MGRCRPIRNSSGPICNLFCNQHVPLFMRDCITAILDEQFGYSWGKSSSVRIVSHIGSGLLYAFLTTICGPKPLSKPIIVGITISAYQEFRMQGNNEISPQAKWILRLIVFLIFFTGWAALDGSITLIKAICRSVACWRRPSFVLGHDCIAAVPWDGIDLDGWVRNWCLRGGSLQHATAACRAPSQNSSTFKKGELGAMGHGDQRAAKIST